MKNNFTLVILFLLCVFSLNTQAALSKGDLAVIGMNGDADASATTRSFAVVALNSIAANEIIFITDRGWVNTYGSTAAHFVSRTTSEGTFQWQPSATIPAGTIIIFKFNLANRLILGTTGSGIAIPDVDLILPSTSWSNPVLSANPWSPGVGDQLIIYQGSDTSPSLIFAFNNIRASLSNVSNGWSTNPTSTEPTITVPTYCELPSDLGTTYSVGFFTSTAIIRYPNEKYVPSLTTGTKSTWLADITNTLNWTNTTSAGSPYNFSLGFGPSNLTSFGLGTDVALSTSPTLTFTSNPSAITSDNIASDGEGGSQAISDINIQIYNISSATGTFSPLLSWQGTSFYGSGSYTGLTTDPINSSKGMAIKSEDGSEFSLNQFVYLNWGESSSFTNTVKGYRNGSEVASTTFDGFDLGYNPKTITLTSAFQNVDEVRFYISAGGYMLDQSATNHSINSIVLASPVVASCINPVITTNPANRTICANSNTTFSISSTGATAYLWQVNSGSGFTVISNGGAYSNATTNTLTITGVTSDMSGFLYRCVAKDGSCSTISSSGTLTISSLSAASGSQTNISCNGGSNGTATVAPGGGISPYTYSWSPSGGTGFTAIGLSAGSYTVTVTDIVGCTATRNFIITQPPAISATPASQTNISCFGGSNGAAAINTATGGAGGYTYNWTPGNPTGDGTVSVTGLTAGTWTCTVTDANTCTTIVNFTITQPTIISTATAAQTNVSCNGGANGSASVTPSGGLGGYTYSWSPSGGTAATATGLSAGTYTVTVTDANSCTATRSFIITQPTVISTATAAQTNVSCNGGSNGSASVTPSGGAGGYTYSWSPSGATAATATGLSAGTYTVTVTDANSCTATRNFTITQPTVISTATAAQTNVSCNGGSNGSASVTPSGGAGGYTYSWSPSGGTAATAIGLSAGTYTEQ